MKTFSAMWSKELEKAIKEAATEPFCMNLVGQDRLDCTRAVNEVLLRRPIDSPLEACFVPERGDRFEDNGRLDCVVSPESLPILIRRLLENGSDLASNICVCLEIELV